MKLTTSEMFYLSVCRSDVLGSALSGIDRASFGPTKQLHVCAQQGSVVSPFMFLNNFRYLFLVSQQKMEEVLKGNFLDFWQRMFTVVCVLVGTTNVLSNLILMDLRYSPMHVILG